MAEIRFEAEWRKSGMTIGGTRGYMGERATGVKIGETAELMSALMAWGDNATEACGQSLERAAEEIMRVAKTLTPVDTGNLRASGHVQPFERGLVKRNVSVVLGFGGPAGVGNQSETNTKDVGYALPVHERFDVRHVNGQAKYLEHAVLLYAPNLEKILADDLRARLPR